VIGSSLLPGIGYEEPIASIPDRIFGTGNIYIYNNEININLIQSTITKPSLHDRNILHVIEPNEYAKASKQTT
jgi:hypothetical protein